MTTTRSRPLSKVKKKMTYLDTEFHYIPSTNLNPLTSNGNYKRILNYFSCDQSNNNTSNITNTIVDIDNKLPTSTHMTEKHTIQQQQPSTKTKNSFHLNKNIKLKLSATSNESKYPLIIKASNSKSTNQQLQRSNVIKILFNNFLSKIKDSYPLLYPEFYSYCLLSASSEVGQSEKETTTLFKNILKKFYSKNSIKNDDLSHNTLFLSTIECLLNDYNHFISKSKRSFINLFVESYKEVIVINYGIFTRQVNDQSEDAKKYEEGIMALKGKIDELNSTVFDLQNQMNLLDLDNQKYQNIMVHQKDEIEGLKEEIEQLKNIIQIKNYELNEVNTKNEDQLKDNLVNGLMTKANDYDEKFDLDKILKNRLERIKFNTFKKDIILKNRSIGNDDQTSLNLNTIQNKSNRFIMNDSDKDKDQDNCNTYRELKENE